SNHNRLPSDNVGTKPKSTVRLSDASPVGPWVAAPVAPASTSASGSAPSAGSRSTAADTTPVPRGSAALMPLSWLFDAVSNAPDVGVDDRYPISGASTGSTAGSKFEPATRTE